jgi:DNA-binding SARP family transcriptional activator
MQFGILGPLEVRDIHGRAVTVSGARERAVLAYLLLNAGRVVSTERLIDDLWGDDPPESARKSLQVRIAGLRKALGADCVLTRPSGYLVRIERDALDLDRFQSLVGEASSTEPAAAVKLLDEALELWRGQGLSDFHHEQWASGAVARMEELRLAAVEKRFDACLELGRHEEVAANLRTFVAEHPLRERFRGQLMLSLYRSGRQAEALDAYQETRRELVGELGLEPGPALLELERGILRRDPALELAPTVEKVRSVLVVALDAVNVEALLALAVPLARRPRRELILVRPNVGRVHLNAVSVDLARRRDRLRTEGIVARTAVFTSADPGRHVVRIAAEQDVDLLLVDAPPNLLEDLELRKILSSAPCDVGVLAGGVIRPGPVVVPFVGAEHDWAAIEIAAWLAAAIDAPLRIAGPATDEDDSSRLLADASLAVQRAFGTAAEPVLLEPGADDLVRLAGESGVVVGGLSDRWRVEGLGPVRAALTAGGTPALLVRRGLRPGGLAPPASYTRFTWTVLPAT